MKTIILFLVYIIALNTLSQTPQINSILVNSCGEDEGINEQVTFTTGSSSLNIDDIEISFPNGGTYCNSGCLTRTLINNQSYLDDLNTIAGCNLFLFSTVIPPNSQVIIFTGINPTYFPDFSIECPGPFYALFCNNTNTTGRFANNAGSDRTLTINFGNSSDQVTYFSSSSNTGSNGDYVSFDESGNPTYLNSTTCALPLPIELVYFEGEHNYKTGVNELNWLTASEANNDRFEIYSSIDGEYWEMIGEVKGAGNSSIEQVYDFTHRPISNLTYYKLKQVDYDGKFEYSNVVSISKQEDKIVSVKYYDILGKELSSEPSNTIFIKVIEYEYRTEYLRVFKL